MRGHGEMLAVRGESTAATRVSPIFLATLKKAECLRVVERDKVLDHVVGNDRYRKFAHLNWRS
jgi:hypothetical protein